MKVLITRPEQDALDTAQAVTALGHEALLAPMLKMRFQSAQRLDLQGVQAILLTSRNGARAFGQAVPDSARGLPVFAVGRSTAAEARALGFADTLDADGDVNDLAALVRNRLLPGAGPLLHVAGSDQAGNLATTLGRAGFDVRRKVLYRAESARTLPTDVTDSLAHRRIDAALFFSPRSAQAFAKLIQGAAELSAGCAVADAICISQATADALQPTRFRMIHVAKRPNHDEMLATLLAASESRSTA